MNTYPSHVRKLKAVELVIRGESLKPAGERDLDTDSIVEKARKIESFVSSQP